MIQTIRDFHYTKEQIGLLFNSKAGTFGANFLIPILFFSIYVTVIPFWYIFVWLCLQIIVFLIRIRISKHGLNAIKQSNEKAIKYYFRYYLGMIFLNALLWGSVSILILEYSEQIFFFMYIIILSGLSAAGSSTLGIVFHAIVIFLVNTLIVVVIIGFYYSTTEIDYILCLFIVIYFLFLLKVSFRNHCFIAMNIEQKEKITKSHNLFKESIEYAALIQKAMLPKEKTLDSCFNEHFVYLKQRDIVGGDFYSVIPLGKGEVIVMVLDGVGHGVSGAFMTMLIKATEHQIITEINNNILELKPAQILLRFNELIKMMVQDNGDTKAIIGFDGGILYFNEKTSFAYYAGAKMPLYIIENRKLHSYKGNRKGIGFVRTPIEQEFTEYEILVTSDTKFYFVTDGILDQEDEEGTRFGRQRFEEFLLRQEDIPFKQQYEALKEEIKIFSGKKAQLDDSTVLGFSLRACTYIR